MKRALSILLVSIFLLGLLASGISCTKTVYVTATSTPTSETQHVVAGCISAMKQVNSYKLDTDVVNVYKAIDGANGGTDTTEWRGTKLISIPHKEMEMNMTIDGGWGDGDIFSTQMYFIDGWEYYKATSPNLYSPNPWDKTKLSDGLWARETQISYYTELLKTANESSLLGSENVNGIDCYVLHIIPSTQAMIDWVISQEQPVGPQMDIMNGGAVSVVRADAYQSGSVKLWIDKSTFLILRANVNSVFSGNVGGGEFSTNPPTTNPVNSSFEGQITFSEYNQPVSIQLPREAISAQEYEIQ